MFRSAQNAAEIAAKDNTLAAKDDMLAQVDQTLAVQDHALMLARMQIASLETSTPQNHLLIGHPRANITQLSRAYLVRVAFAAIFQR